MEIDGVKLILVCVYGYNSRALNKLFYADLCVKINQWKVIYSTDEVIIGGDFNLVPDNSVDRLPTRGHHHTFDDIFNSLVSNTNLIDCWRLKNSDIRQYTWFNASSNGQCSRLDYWLIPFNWFDNILGLGDMAQKIITIIIFISVDIDNYHDKCQIFISFKFKARFLLQSESFRNQTINFP